MLRFSMILFIFVAIPVTGATQGTKYSTWSDPSKTQASASDKDVAGFAAKLNKLVDEAEKARAADPVFLKDLRDLANSYLVPALQTILSDSFDDGDYTQNPTWQVLAGDYFIEKGWGLRNRIIQQNSNAGSSNSSASGEDVAIAILGSILQQATGSQSQTAPTPSVTENVIISSVRISNAFSMTLALSSWVAGGNFEAGVYQGNDARAGYRLVYQSGQPVQLIKVGSSGQTTIAQSTATVAIEDKNFHKIVWSRGQEGIMTVMIDGTEILRASDKSFSDAFDGVRLSDEGGDFIIKSISVSGT